MQEFFSSSCLFLIGLSRHEHGKGVFLCVGVSMCAAHMDGQALTASFAFFSSSLHTTS